MEVAKLLNHFIFINIEQHNKKQKYDLTQKKSIDYTFLQLVNKRFYFSYNLMGCVDSTIHTVELYTLLNQITKDSIRNFISQDNLPAIADLQAQTNYPTAIELSQTGLLWTTLHFCCRFDAPNCLEYFLRKCYLQEPGQYIQFVNHQTIDGSTALHLCIIWNSQKCLMLLLKYGGLNLGLKNKSHKTILNVSQDYSRNQITQLLCKCEKKFGKIVPWRYALLQEPISFKNKRESTFYQNLTTEINKLCEQKEQDSSSQQVCKQELELRELKKTLEQEKEEIHQSRIKIESQIEQNKSKMAEPRGKIELNEGPNNLEIQTKKKEFTKQQIVINKKIKDKEEQLQNVKKAIDLLQCQAAYKLLRAEQEKAFAGRKLQEEIMNNFVQMKLQLLKIHKQSQKERKESENKTEKPKHKQQQKVVEKTKEDQKNTVQITINQKVVKNNLNSPRNEEIVSSKMSCLSAADMTNFNKLPKNIQLLYQQAVAQGSFQDKEFPHNINSLGGTLHQAKIRPFLQSLVWLRPSIFLGKKYRLFDGIDCNDVKQGLLGVCYCLATIADLAQDPQEIIKIFPFHDLDLGFYVLRFFAGGKPTYVVVDDYFPCNNSSLQPLFSKPIGQEVWVLLIEKAWAKLVGSYFGAEQMTPEHFMQDLTGYPTFGCFFKNKTDKLKDIIQCSKRGYPIVLTTGEKRMEGIISSHSYSLLKIYQYQNNRIYKVRNPWGRFQWNGRYGQNSPAWTPELKIKCEFVAGDQGIFFLSEAQILEIFVYYSIAFDEQGYNYSYVSFTSKREESKYFKIVHKGGKASLRVSQPFKRMMSHQSDYRYSPVVFEVGRIEKDGVVFISEGNEKCFMGQKSVYASNDIFSEYEPGEYLIRVKMQWVLEQKYNQAVFSYFGKQIISFQQLTPEVGSRLWEQMIMNFAENKPKKVLNEQISYSMYWMRGQMICYAQLKPEVKNDTFRVKWQFNQNQLKNCQLDLKKSTQNSIQYVLDSSKRKNLGTVLRLSLLKSCSSGSVSMQSFKI